MLIFQFQMKSFNNNNNNKNNNNENNDSLLLHRRRINYLKLSEII